MATLINRVTGIVISVSDEKVARFNSDWEAPAKPEAEPEAEAEAEAETTKRPVGRPRKN